jgi:hypothetical protein
MDGGGGAQRPFWRVNEPKKTGACSARARTRGQNPLVIQYWLSPELLTLMERFYSTDTYFRDKYLH